MITIAQLKNFPDPKMIDETLIVAADKVAKNLRFTPQNLRSLSQSLWVLRAFLNITDQQLILLDINHPGRLTSKFRQFIGFIYTETDASLSSGYSLIRILSVVFSNICMERSLLVPNFPKISERFINDDMKTCLAEYQALTPDPKLLRYYEGWPLTSKDGHRGQLHLEVFYNQFGPECSQRWHQLASNYFKKSIHTTFVTSVSHFNSIIDSICFLCPNLKSLQEATTEVNINKFIELIFSKQKLDVVSNNYDIPSFYNCWGSRARLIDKILIKGGYWPTPLYEIFIPKFRTVSQNKSSHRKSDNQGNAFCDKLITHIPLSYSDDETIEALLQSIENDIDHVVHACQKIVEQIRKNLKRRKQFALIGQEKLRLTANETRILNLNKDGINMTLEENQVATWLTHNYNLSCGDASSFLGFKGKDAALKFAWNNALPGKHTIIPILHLLIHHHPEITESWLLSWKLFDKNDKLYGFRQSGGQWIAVSMKRRRGAKSAQQTIILNQESTELIKTLITVTKPARDYLRKEGNTEWRAMLISSPSFAGKPRSIKHITKVAQNSANSPFAHELSQPSPTVDTDRAQGILKNLSLTTMRASKGVQIYLKTKSVKAMSEALGHKRYDPQLLSRYLPDPILNYFQRRWVRIFQNAIIYEAMKESDYLFDALDFGESELENFLRNHRLKPLPEHLRNGELGGLDIKPITYEHKPVALIPVCPLVLRVLNALVELVETIDSRQQLTTTAIDWYETAKFITRTIDINDDNASCSPEVIEAMAHARANPIEAKKLKGAVYAEA